MIRCLFIVRHDEPSYFKKSFLICIEKIGAKRATEENPKKERKKSNIKKGEKIIAEALRLHFITLSHVRSRHFTRTYILTLQSQRLLLTNFRQFPYPLSNYWTYLYHHESLLYKHYDILIPNLHKF